MGGPSAEDDPRLVLLRLLRPDLRRELRDGEAAGDQTVLGEVRVNLGELSPPLPGWEL